MLQSKQIVFFFLKALVIYGLLVLPLSFDTSYAKFYRVCGKQFFGKIQGKGFVMFNESKGKYDTRIIMGNYAQVLPNGKAAVVSRPLSVHYMGYMSTILLVSLVLATPIVWKRKLVSLIIGLVLLTLFIMFKQWIHLLFLNISNPWLRLYQFNDAQKTIIEYLYPKLADSLGTSWFVVVVIWLLISFRKDDLKMIIAD